MKGRESGMPDVDSWERFYQASDLIGRLIPAGTLGSIAEFGCGYGTFTLPVAAIFDGTVFGFDIEADLVALVVRRAADQSLENVRVACRDFVDDGTGLSDNSVAHAMLYNILHIEEPLTLLREAARILRPGGTISIIHWRSDICTPRGPPIAIRPSPEQCGAWAELVGFRGLEKIDLGSSAPWHFGLRLRKPRD